MIEINLMDSSLQVAPLLDWHWIALLATALLIGGLHHLRRTAR